MEQQRARRASRHLRVVLALGALALPGLAAQPSPGAPTAAAALDFTLGHWRGVRRDAADGSAAPLTVRVERILDGGGLAEHLEVRHAGGVYRGHAAQVLDPELGRWVRMYVNATHRRFVRLEGEVVGDTVEWRSVATARPRRTRVVAERPAPDRWRRTSWVSEDGGETWRVLFVDDLVRAPAAAASPPPRTGDASAGPPGAPRRR